MRLSTFAIVVALSSLALSATAAARPHCAGKKATIVGTPGRDHLVGRGGRQVIAGLGGRDKIVAQGGGDIVCGGAGNDLIKLGSGNDVGIGGAGADKILGGIGSEKLAGGRGNDTLDGGDGRDILLGGGGNDGLDGAGAADLSLDGGGGADEILGGPGSDLLKGGAGADHLFAGLQDDSLLGGDGDDVVVGGHGVDDMNGGSGSDILRGGLNGDTYNGDAGGADMASFATAVPPGPNSPPDVTGVDVNLNIVGNGTASGDEVNDALAGIERVLGSPFDDTINGPGGIGSVDGGGGADQCTGFASRNCSSSPRTSAIVAVVGEGGPDPGLVLLGGPASSSSADSFTATPVSGGVRVSYASSLGGVVVGPGCNPTALAQAFCTTTQPLGYILGWGDDGDDSFSIGAGFDLATEIVLDGGPGDDTLTGGPTSEEMLAGAVGSDRLIGNGGDDALFARGADPDTLAGGDGNDQFVVDNACGGNILTGGPGNADVVGFASETERVRATLSGGAFRIGQGGADLCPGTHTTIGSDNEVLEGGPLGDLLFGDARSNPLILGRNGDDAIHGGAGADFLRGWRTTTGCSETPAPTP